MRNSKTSEYRQASVVDDSDVAKASTEQGGCKSSPSPVEDNPTSTSEVADDARTSARISIDWQDEERSLRESVHYLETVGSSWVANAWKWLYTKTTPRHMQKASMATAAEDGTSAMDDLEVAGSSATEGENHNEFTQNSTIAQAMETFETKNGVVHRGTSVRHTRPLLHRWRVEARLHRYLRRNRATPLLLFLFVMLLAVLSGVLYYFNNFAADSPTFGQLEEISCLATTWWGAYSCGVYAQNCQPLTGGVFGIRCPPLCQPATSWKVFGSGPYRADSSLCRAAIHAGVIGKNGGCTAVVSTGPQQSFTGSTQNGVTTETSDMLFPESFEFDTSYSFSMCTNFGWALLVFNMLAVFAMLFLVPPAWLWFMVLTNVVYWYVTFFADPTFNDSGLERTVANLAYYNLYLAVAYWFIVRVSLFPIAWIFDLFLFYMIPLFFVSHLSMFNLFLPDFSLSPGDIQGVGTIIYVVVLMLILLFAVIYLCRDLYRMGLIPYYIVGYGAAILVIVIGTLLATTNDFEIHVHHWFLAVFLMPFTAVESRVAMIVQGVLLGMLADGTSRWGMASLWVPNDSGSWGNPPDISGSVTNATELEIEWTSDYNGTDSTLATFALFMNDFLVYNDFDNTTTISGLYPNTTYAFCVSQIYNGSPGPCSDVLNLTTPADPNVDPSEITIMDRFNSSALVTSVLTIMNGPYTGSLEDASPVRFADGNPDDE
eukprot:Clim_evm49s246 gene=Clim_evmTU49s246